MLAIIYRRFTTSARRKVTPSRTDRATRWVENDSKVDPAGDRFYGVGEACGGPRVAPQEEDRVNQFQFHQHEFSTDLSGVHARVKQRVADEADDFLRRQCCKD